MAYVTKDKSNLIQLWNNKPSYSSSNGIFYAWKQGLEGIDNEISIDVSNNKSFVELVLRFDAPIRLQIKSIDYCIIHVL